MSLPNNRSGKEGKRDRKATVAAGSKLNYNVYMSHNYCFLKYSPSLENAEHLPELEAFHSHCGGRFWGFIPSQEGIKTVEVNHFEI